MNHVTVPLDKVITVLRIDLFMNFLAQNRNNTYVKMEVELRVKFSLKVIS